MKSLLGKYFGHYWFHVFKFFRMEREESWVIQGIIS